MRTALNPVFRRRAGADETAVAARRPTGGESMSYVLEWIPGVGFLGAVLLLLIVPPFALIALAVVALVALAALLALAGAVLAAPYLLVRSLRQRHPERRRSPAGSGPLARVIAQAGRAGQRAGVAALPSNHSKEITVNPSAPTAHTGELVGRHITDAPADSEPEAVDQLIARVLHHAHRTADAHDEPEVERAILQVAQSFADELATANPRFDRLRFIRNATEERS
jgi:hypothetical protein